MTEILYSPAFSWIGNAPHLRGACFYVEAPTLVERKVDDIKNFWLLNPETMQIVNAKYYTNGGTTSIT